MSLIDWRFAIRQMDLGEGAREMSFYGGRGKVFDLSRLRAAAGLNQATVAERTGWKRSAVSRLEHSKVCSVASMVDYAGACGYDVMIVAVRKDSPIVVL